MKQSKLRDLLAWFTFDIMATKVLNRGCWVRDSYVDKFGGYNGDQRDFTVTATTAMILSAVVHESGKDQGEWYITKQTNRGKPIGDWKITVERVENAE